MSSRRERVARAIFPWVGGHGGHFDFDDAIAEHERQQAFIAADQAIAAVHAGTTRITRFVAGFVAMLIGAAVIVGLVGLVVQLGRWVWS